MTNNSEKERVEGSEGVIEGNKLIAEFLGAKEKEDRFYFREHPDKSKEDGSGFLWPSDELQYHTSWSWLMPVVKKIQQLSIEDFSKKRPVMNALMDVEIETLWQEVVSFIKYHNQLKNK